MRVRINGQLALFVNVPNIETPCRQQLSTATGVSNCQFEPHSTVRFVGQNVNTGGVVSTTVTVWLHLAVNPLQSVPCHIRVIFMGHVPLVVVFSTVSVILVPQHALVARGSSKAHVVPHSTVLLGGQMIVPGGQGELVGVVTLNARLMGTPCGSIKVFQAAGNGALPHTA